MRKIVIFIAVISGLFLGLGSFNLVFAQCQCVDWENTMICQPIDIMCPPPNQDIVCQPAGCYDVAVCVSNDCGITCGPGYYACNSGCCAVGTGTPGGGGGGGGGGCNGRTVNCPIGYIRTSTVSNVECKSDYGGTAAWCTPPGTAQAVTGCCSAMVRCEDETDPEKNDCCRYGDDQITTYTCVPICNTTPPVITGITTLSPTKATINWTAGTGGSKQKIFIGANKSLVESNCVGNQSPACVVNVQNLTASQTSYTTGNVLSSGTVYYVRVINSGGSSCNSNSQTAKFLSSCLLLPSAVTKNINQTQDLISNLSSSTEITKVKYTSNSTGVASVSPTNDAAYIYKTTATAKSVGNATVTSDVYFGSVITCTANSTVTVTSPADAWWQVKDSDVSSNGDLITNVPSGKYFDIDGTGGFPGIPAASGTTDLDGTNVSSTDWLVDSLQTNAKVYDHAYFNNQIPKDTVITVVPSNTIDGSILESGGTLSYGYYWYRYDGSDSGLDLTITAPVDLGSRKVILLVDSASLYINGSINLSDGEGFFVSLVSGNINIAGTVATLEGIYESNGSFTTGAGTSQLLVRGG